jgi:sugar O-acyltransferase (sialic acid O-acetyltransferase NeuD family)
VCAEQRQPTQIVLLGCGLYAEELTDLIAAIDTLELVAYCENRDRTKAGGELLGRPIVWVDDLPSLGDVRAVSAITTTERDTYIDQVAALGIEFATVVHPSAVVARSVSLGAGVVIQAGVVLGAQTRIADHVMINRGALIGHHVTIAEFATVQPGAVIGGACEIGARAYVALGANIVDRIVIGDGSLVAAGALVVRDVAAHTQVMGVPARVVKHGVTGRAT